MGSVALRLAPCSQTVCLSSLLPVCNWWRLLAVSSALAGTAPPPIFACFTLVAVQFFGRKRPHKSTALVPRRLYGPLRSRSRRSLPATTFRPYCNWPHITCRNNSAAGVCWLNNCHPFHVDFRDRPRPWRGVARPHHSLDVRLRALPHDLHV